MSAFAAARKRLAERLRAAKKKGVDVRRDVEKALWDELDMREKLVASGSGVFDPAIYPEDVIASKVESEIVAFDTRLEEVLSHAESLPAEYDVHTDTYTPDRVVGNVVALYADDLEGESGASMSAPMALPYLPEPIGAELMPTAAEVEKKAIAAARVAVFGRVYEYLGFGVPDAEKWSEPIRLIVRKVIKKLGEAGQRYAELCAVGFVNTMRGVLAEYDAAARELDDYKYADGDDGATMDAAIGGSIYLRVMLLTRLKASMYYEHVDAFARTEADYKLANVDVVLGTIDDDIKHKRPDVALMAGVFVQDMLKLVHPGDVARTNTAATIYCMLMGMRMGPHAIGVYAAFRVQSLVPRPVKLARMAVSGESYAGALALLQGVVRSCVETIATEGNNQSWAIPVRLMESVVPALASTGMHPRCVDVGRDVIAMTMMPPYVMDEWKVDVRATAEDPRRVAMVALVSAGMTSNKWRNAGLAYAGRAACYAASLVNDHMSDALIMHTGAAAAGTVARSMPAENTWAHTISAYSAAYWVRNACVLMGEIGVALGVNAGATYEAAKVTTSACPSSASMDAVALVFKLALRGDDLGNIGAAMGDYMYVPFDRTVLPDFTPISRAMRTVWLTAVLGTKDKRDEITAAVFGTGLPEVNAEFMGPAIRDCIRMGIPVENLGPHMAAPATLTRNNPALCDEICALITARLKAKVLEGSGDAAHYYASVMCVKSITAGDPAAVPMFVYGMFTGDYSWYKEEKKGESLRLVHQFKAHCVRTVVDKRGVVRDIVEAVMGALGDGATAAEKVRRYDIAHAIGSPTGIAKAADLIETAATSGEGPMPVSERRLRAYHGMAGKGFAENIAGKMIRANMCMSTGDWRAWISGALDVQVRKLGYEARTQFAIDATIRGTSSRTPTLVDVHNAMDGCANGTTIVTHKHMPVICANVGVMCVYGASTGMTGQLRRRYVMECLEAIKIGGTHKRWIISAVCRELALKQITYVHKAREDTAGRYGATAASAGVTAAAMEAADKEVVIAMCRHAVAGAAGAATAAEAAIRAEACARVAWIDLYGGMRAAMLGLDPAPLHAANDKLVAELIKTFVPGNTVWKHHSMAASLAVAHRSLAALDYEEMYREAKSGDDAATTAAYNRMVAVVNTPPAAVVMGAPGEMKADECVAMQWETTVGMCGIPDSLRIPHVGTSLSYLLVCEVDNATRVAARRSAEWTIITHRWLAANIRNTTMAVSMAAGGHPLTCDATCPLVFVCRDIDLSPLTMEYIRDFIKAMVPVPDAPPIVAPAAVAAPAVADPLLGRMPLPPVGGDHVVTGEWVLAAATAMSSIARFEYDRWKTFHALRAPLGMNNKQMMITGNMMIHFASRDLHAGVIVVDPAGNITYAAGSPQETLHAALQPGENTLPDIAAAAAAASKLAYWNTIVSAQTAAVPVGRAMDMRDGVTPGFISTKTPVYLPMAPGHSSDDAGHVVRGGGASILCAMSNPYVVGALVAIVLVVVFILWATYEGEKTQGAAHQSSPSTEKYDDRLLITSS
jgi:hypothetical protein